jgi:dihydrolipoamide dehydrogenase
LSDREADLCVIGAGPGGYVAAIKAAQLGLKAVVVERDQLGGVCLNQGCIPTKAMLRSANLFETIQHADQFGIKVDGAQVDFGGVLKFRDKVVKGLVGGVGALLQSLGVEVVKGTATLAGPDRVRVDGPDGGEIRAGRGIILATGSAPANLPIPGADSSGVIDSNGALALTEVPKSMLVIGGGAVGCEWANVFHAFGCQVTLVEMLPTLLPVEDEEMGRGLARSFTRRGIAVKTSAKIEKIEGCDGSLTCTVVGEDGKSEQVEVEKVLIGVGRKPLSEGLGLEQAGVKVERGFVVVDDQLRTNVPTVFAIGDLTGKKLLAHLASHQGIVAAENIAGHEATIDYKAVPGCTYTHPEVASVGLTEKQAREAGHDVLVGRFPFSASGRAQTAGDTDGMVKVVADSKYGEILGVHILGADASEMIPEGVLALKLEATLEDITTTIHAHPTLAEATMEAALAATGQAIHLPKPRERRS